MNPVRFDNPVLADAYARAVERCAALPDTERLLRLSEAASALRGLDTDQPADALRPQANVVVASTCTATPAPRDAGGVSASRGRILPAGIQVAPNIAIDPDSGLPRIDGKQPSNWSEAASALYDCARAIADTREGNLFAQVPMRTRKAMLESLTRVFDVRQFAGEALEGNEAAQLRASTATLLRHLMASVLEPETGDQRQLLASTLALCDRMARAEPHTGVRDSMIFGLYRYQTQLPEELRATTRALMRDQGKLAPPYEKWAEDGVIGVDLVCDGDGMNMSRLASKLARQGFTQVADRENVFTREVHWDGRSVTIEVTTRVNRRNMFENAADPGTDIVFYMGHSGYGTNIPKSTERAPAGSGQDKLFAFCTCFGKANYEHVRQAYPEGQILSTFESATTWNAFSAARVLWDGIEERKPWAAMRRDLGRNPRQSNWVTPADVMLRRRIMDSDGDGRADLLDRVFDFDLQRPGASSSFEPKDPGHPPHRLQMLHGVTTANWLNRGVGGYNAPVRRLNSSARVACGGFFDGGPDQPPVRFETTTFNDERNGWIMTVNDHFAHMSEESLRVVATHEFNRFLAENDSRFQLYEKPLEAKVNGLMSVAFTLSHDLWSNDRGVWSDFLSAYGLPEDLDRYQLKRFADRHNGDAGTVRNVGEYLDEIQANDPDLYAALAEDGAGTWQG